MVEFRIGHGVDISLVLKKLVHDKAMAVLPLRLTSLIIRRLSPANHVWKPSGYLYIQDQWERRRELQCSGIVLKITQRFHGLRLQGIIDMDKKFREMMVNDVFSVKVCLSVRNRKFEAELEIYLLAHHNSREQKITGGWICGDVKLHLKHKWRARLLQTLSELELFVDIVVLITSLVKVAYSVWGQQSDKSVNGAVCWAKFKQILRNGSRKIVKTTKLKQVIVLASAGTESSQSLLLSCFIILVQKLLRFEELSLVNCFRQSRLHSHQRRWTVAHVLLLGQQRLLYLLHINGWRRFLFSAIKYFFRDKEEFHSSNRMNNHEKHASLRCVLRQVESSVMMLFYIAESLNLWRD